MSARSAILGRACAPTPRWWLLQAAGATRGGAGISSAARRSTRPTCRSSAHWSANPLGMLWPEMDRCVLGVRWEWRPASHGAAPSGPDRGGLISDYRAGTRLRSGVRPTGGKGMQTTRPTSIGDEIRQPSPAVVRSHRHPDGDHPDSNQCDPSQFVAVQREPVCDR